MKHIKFHNLYYSLAVTNRKAKNYSSALNYLDSCTLSRPQASYDNTPFLNVERGCIYLEMGDFKNSETHLHEAFEYFRNKQLSYSIISSLHLGDLYFQQEKWDSASIYYKTCLETLNNFNSHGDVAAVAHRQLAISLEHLNKTEEAYVHLNSALAITDSLFNAKTAINSELFQMKNKYKETIQEQQLVIERKNIIQSRLILLIALIAVALIALLIYIRMRHQLHESSLRRKKIELQAQLDQEKAAEILELKNRELTANTLKIIDKEQTIEELLATIKKDSPANYKSLKIKSSISNKDMWEQFNMRFIEVNAHFYDDLRANHPNLTPTEHKHCALIKLNFDSKEMASLLNISLSSVHISRHRIRKKMGLEREDSLSNYIADITR